MHAFPKKDACSSEKGCMLSLKSIVSGEHFLSMTHKTEATKAQYF